MDNNQDKNVNAFTFDNLRTLSVLLSGNELNGLVGGINKARKALDVYCQTLKVKEKDFAVSTQPQKVPSATNNQPTAPRPVKNGKFNNATPGKTTNFAPRKQGEFFARRNEQGGKTNFKPNGARPERTGSATNKRTFGRTAELDIVQKPERSVGNKNKSKSHDNENSKGLSIKSKIRMGFVELEDYENEDRIGRVRKVKKATRKNSY